jgi:chemotaxis protein methyltransferase CheR
MKAHIGILDKEERSFEFNQHDFKTVQKLIYEHAGIRLSDAKQDMVYSRMIRRLRATGLNSFADYLRLIETDKAEWEAFVNSLTTNLTSFFREEYHVPMLAEFLKQKSGQIRIWCSAASTGEEPYSIAMTVIDALGADADRVEIVATDIDTSVLAKAEAGVYSEDRIERIDAKYKKYFLKGSGSRAGLVRVKPEVQRLVSFRQLNLLALDWPVEGEFDVLFCRNVLIYFDKETQRKVLERFIPLMCRDGLLFIGHSESLLHLSELFKLRGKTVYELRQTGKVT